MGRGLVDFTGRYHTPAFEGQTRILGSVASN